jgi:hypothetical protein
VSLSIDCNQKNAMWRFPTDGKDKGLPNARTHRERRTRDQREMMLQHRSSLLATMGGTPATPTRDTCVSLDAQGNVIATEDLVVQPPWLVVPSINYPGNIFLRIILNECHFFQ